MNPDSNEKKPNLLVKIFEYLEEHKLSIFQILCLIFIVSVFLIFLTARESSLPEKNHIALDKFMASQDAQQKILLKNIFSDEKNNKD